MRCRKVTAVPVVLAGIFGLSAAFAAEPVPRPAMIAAAPWAVNTLAADSLGVVRSPDYALGGVTILPFSEPGAAGLPEVVAVNREAGVRIALSQGRNWDAYGSVFAAPSSLSSNYLGGSTTYAGANVALSPEMNLQFNHSRLDLGAFDATPAGSSAADLARRFGQGVQLMGTTSASLNWNFADWGGVALTAARSSGNGLLLGSIATAGGPPGLTDSATLGISARMGFGEGWVTTLAYSEGVTQLDLNRAALNGGFDPIRSNAYALGLAKRGVFGSDALGISLSRPLQLYNEAFNPSHARESDLELGYVTTFLDGTIALQANAAYQLNAAGAKGENAVTGVARAKLNF